MQYHIIGSNPDYTEFYHGDIESAEPERNNHKLFLSVTIPHPLTPMNILAVTMSLIPFVEFLIVLAWFAFTKSSLALYAAMATGFATITSELCLKNVAKQKRPKASMAESYGMPSSHCAATFSNRIYLAAEVAIRHSYPLPAKAFMVACIAVSPAPIPWARHYLGDHSGMQCLAGCLTGNYTVHIH
eukprot:GHVO01038728.1.p1 GENE.GHVO01038728.1~~GHVO01038728.1.p1  ORF type:complete len:186 (+),score=13.99 GHVO01038728.1:118-675(+)